MKTIIAKVIEQTESVYVPSKKNVSGQVAKCNVRLRELGGDYEDEYACTLFGDNALKRVQPGQTVIAALRFQTHESGDVCYQDIVATEVLQLKIE